MPDLITLLKTDFIVSTEINDKISNEGEISYLRRG